MAKVNLNTAMPASSDYNFYICTTKWDRLTALLYLNLTLSDNDAIFVFLIFCLQSACMGVLQQYKKQRWHQLLSIHSLYWNTRDIIWEGLLTQSLVVSVSWKTKRNSVWIFKKIDDCLICYSWMWHRTTKLPWTFCVAIK